MPNLKAKIDGHNKTVFENTPSLKTNLCSCLKKENCPMKEENCPMKEENCPMKEACLTQNVLYFARISCDDKTYKPKLCKGICKTTFKKRRTNRKKSFNTRRARTTLNCLLNTES